MNDGTNIASDDIILKPKFRYWLMKNFLLITLAIFVFIFSKYIIIKIYQWNDISIVDIYNFLQIYFNVTLYKMDYN